MIHPEDLPRLMEKWVEARISGRSCVLEIRYKRHDGVYRWMHTRACPLIDDNGDVLKWYGTNTDITDIVMSRIEAKRNTDQMKTVLAHAEVNLFRIDTNRQFTMIEGGMSWTKGTMAEKFFPSQGSIMGKDVFEVMHITQLGGIPGRFSLVNSSVIMIL